MSNGNVTPIRLTTSPPTPESSGSGGDGGGSDLRLAAIESRLAAMETRLTVLETDSKHYATKEDIQKLKVWVLGGVLGGMLSGLAIAAGLAITLLKMFAG